nr:MAG TPA: hypothetical protein [Caudoviricetes sp.]
MVNAAPKVKKSKNAGNVIDYCSSLSQMLLQMV